MAEAIWYFADGDEERGPVTEAQIRALIGTGNLKRDDLVWKEGMDDWMPANEVPGLFQPEATAKPATATAKQTPQPASKPTGEAAVVPPATAPVEPAVVRPRRVMTRPSLDVTQPLNIFQWGAFLGQPLLLIGFALVLLTRGCDSLGDRYVDRAVARAKVAEAQFNDAWDARIAKLTRQRDEYQAEGPAARDRMAEVSQAIADLEENRRQEEAALRDGKWRDLAATARDAEASRDMWRFWREGFFWFATALFSLGLLIISFTGQATERWLSLALLAVIVYAVYVAG